MLIYWAMLTAGPFAVGGGLSALGRLMARQRAGAPGHGLGRRAAMAGLAGLTTLVLMALYALTPNRHVPRKHRSIGATVAALVLTLTQKRLWRMGSGARNPLVFGAVSAFPIYCCGCN